jgi:hypothetical protein
MRIKPPPQTHSPSPFEVTSPAPGSKAHLHTRDPQTRDRLTGHTSIAPSIGIGWQAWSPTPTSRAPGGHFCGRARDCHGCAAQQTHNPGNQAGTFGTKPQVLLPLVPHAMCIFPVVSTCSGARYGVIQRYPSTPHTVSLAMSCCVRDLVALTIRHPRAQRLSTINPESSLYKADQGFRRSCPDRQSRRDLKFRCWHMWTLRVPAPPYSLSPPHQPMKYILLYK